MILTYIDLKYVSLIYRKIHQKVPNGKGLRLGSQRHRHFVGFFNMPDQAPTRGQPFYVYSDKPPHFSRLLLRA